MATFVQDAIPTLIIRNDCWEYDDSNDSWIQVASPGSVSRKGVSAFTINNKAYICTGIDSSNRRLNELWEYTPVTAIKENKPHTFYTITIHHSTHQLIITFNEGITGAITLSDVMGSKIAEEILQDKNVFDISTASLKSGIYFLIIKSASINTAEKIFIK